MTYLFDRGYNCYAFFATICEMGAYFVTRLCANKEEAREKLARTYLRGIKHRLFNEVSEAEVGAYRAGLAINTS